MELPAGEALCERSGEWLRAGRIVGVYGIRGWVRVQAFTEEPEDLLSMPVWQLRGRARGSEVRETVQQDAQYLEGRRHGRGLIVHLPGVDDRTAAEGLRGTEIWVPASALPELDDGDYYWRDLVGLRVYTNYQGGELLLGKVDHLLETGANDVLVLKPCEGSVDQRERLLPYLPGTVVDAVDLAGRCMTVRWHPDD